MCLAVCFSFCPLYFFCLCLTSVSTFLFLTTFFFLAAVEVIVSELISWISKDFLFFCLQSCFSVPLPFRGFVLALRNQNSISVEKEWTEIVLRQDVQQRQVQPSQQDGGGELQDGQHHRHLQLQLGVHLRSAEKQIRLKVRIYNYKLWSRLMLLVTYCDQVS